MTKMITTSGQRTPDQDWSQLRRAAVEAVCGGWPVIPGVLEPHAGVERVRPESTSWLTSPATNPDEAWELWREHPYAVLLVCGRGIDALEVPLRVYECHPALARAGLVTPVASALGPSRWVLFATTGSGTLCPELQDASVHLHGRNEWVPLPPTAVAGYQPLTWVVRPAEDDWLGTLPDVDAVQDTLAAALTQ